MMSQERGGTINLDERITYSHKNNGHRYYHISHTGYFSLKGFGNIVTPS